MIHDQIHYQWLLAADEDHHRRTRGRHVPPGSGHARRRPGRLRRSSAIVLLRAAERLAREPAATLPRRA